MLITAVEMLIVLICVAIPNVPVRQNVHHKRTTFVAVRTRQGVASQTEGNALAFKGRIEKEKES